MSFSHLDLEVVAFCALCHHCCRIVASWAWRATSETLREALLLVTGDFESLSRLWDRNCDCLVLARSHRNRRQATTRLFDVHIGDLRCERVSKSKLRAKASLALLLHIELWSGNSPGIRCWRGHKLRLLRTGLLFRPYWLCIHYHGSHVNHTTILLGLWRSWSGAATGKIYWLQVQKMIIPSDLKSNKYLQ